MKSVVLLPILFGQLVFASGDKGNGAGVHLCPGNKIEFYDLYEGVNGRPDRPAPPVANWAGNASEITKKVIEKLGKANYTLAVEVKRQLEHLNRSANQSLVTKKLKLVDDANNLRVDKECSYQQLANWNDQRNHLYINKKLYLALVNSAVNMAAFKLHEALYKAERRFFNVSNSDHIREVISWLFSGKTVPARLMKAYESIEIPVIDDKLKSEDMGKVFLDLGKIKSTNRVRLTILPDGLPDRVDLFVNKERVYKKHELTNEYALDRAEDIEALKHLSYDIVIVNNSRTAIPSCKVQLKVEILNGAGQLLTESRIELVVDKAKVFKLKVGQAAH